jgi:hypothetical protein
MGLSPSNDASAIICKLTKYIPPPNNTAPRAANGRISFRHRCLGRRGVSLWHVTCRGFRNRDAGLRVWRTRGCKRSGYVSPACLFAALLKEGSVQCSKCSKRSLSSRWRRQSFFSHCSARSHLARFLPQATKIPDGSIVLRSYGRNTTGRKLPIVARRVAKNSTALGRPRTKVGSLISAWWLTQSPSNPSQAPNSLVNREINREFCGIRPHQNTHQSTRLDRGQRPQVPQLERASSMVCFWAARIQCLILAKACTMGLR